MSAFQIREFPGNLKRSLARRARKENTTMSDYALTILREALDRPDKQEIRERLSKLAPVDLGVSAAELLQECRPESDLTATARRKRR